MIMPIFSNGHSSPNSNKVGRNSDGSINPEHKNRTVEHGKEAERMQTVAENRSSDSSLSDELVLIFNDLLTCFGFRKNDQRKTEKQDENKTNQAKGDMGNKPSVNPLKKFIQRGQKKKVGELNENWYKRNYSRLDVPTRNDCH